jgi:hypothetical protein
MLGGRSTQHMWINQAQIFGEVHRFVSRKETKRYVSDGRGLSHDRAYGFLRDVFKAARGVFGEAWGDNKRYMVTRDVTIKALVRVAGDLAAVGKTLSLEPGDNNAKVLQQRFAPWGGLTRDFRREGFYERFPARGQVERVEKIRTRLVREARIK